MPGRSRHASGLWLSLRSGPLVLVARKPTGSSRLRTRHAHGVRQAALLLAHREGARVGCRAPRAVPCWAARARGPTGRAREEGAVPDQVVAVHLHRAGSSLRTRPQPCRRCSAAPRAPHRTRSATGRRHHLGVPVPRQRVAGRSLARAPSGRLGGGPILDNAEMSVAPALVESLGPPRPVAHCGGTDQKNRRHRSAKSDRYRSSERGVGSSWKAQSPWTPSEAAPRPPPRSRGARV